MPAEQFAHALHSLSFDSTENFPETQSAHTRSAWYVPSDATNFPPKQLVHAVHATVDEANVPFSQVVVFVEVDVSAVVVGALVVGTALLLASVRCLQRVVSKVVRNDGGTGAGLKNRVS